MLTSPPTPSSFESGQPASSADTRSDRFRLLVEMGRDFVSAQHLDHLLQMALERAMDFSGHNGGSVLLLAGPEGPLVVRAAAGADAVPVGTRVDDLARSVAGRALHERRPLILRGRGEDLGTDWRTYTRPIPSVICLPLIVADERPLGVLALKSTTQVRHLDDDDIDALQLLASQLAAMVERAQFHDERNRLLHDLADREQRLQHLLGQLMVAHEEERRRIAYDLHDGLAQIAASTHQHLQSFASHYRPRSVPARQNLEQALEMARRTVKEARQVIAGLRPTALDDLGLAIALRLEVEALQAQGWEITFDENLRGVRLPTVLETTFFRAAQEALSNVRKHARSTRVQITLQHDAHALRMHVRDWGCGFDLAAATVRQNPGERIGLLSLHERVALLGGQCRIESRPGAGTTVLIDVPFSSPA